MSHTKEGQELYAALLALNQSVFTQGLYEAAYHYLAAALHCTQAILNAQTAKAVEQLALAQLRHIDQVAPEHKLSTKSVEARHGLNLYQQLARIAETEAQLFAKLGPPPFDE